MAPPPPPPEEIAQLMRFIAEKVKNVKSPMNIGELCRQFKEERGSSVVSTTLILKVNTNRHKIHRMNEFDMETKVRMMFALNASINAGFLEELKKVADVEVDDQQRIIRYKQKDGGLEMSGRHLRVPIKMEEQRDREMIQLLTEKSETTDTPMVDNVFLREFKEKTACPDSIELLVHRYRHVKRTIYHLTGIDKNTKIKMMFISNAQLPDDVLEELRKDADVEVDEKSRIISYKQKGGGLELSGRRLRNPQKDGEMRLSAESIFQFLANKSKTTDKPIADKVFLKEIKEKTACSDSIETLFHRYRRVKNTIFQSTEIEKNTKIKMIFISNAKLSDDVLEELQKDADVDVDEKGRITKYQSKDGRLELEKSHVENNRKYFYQKSNEKKSERDDGKNTNRQKGYEKTQTDLVRFLIQRTKHATSPLSIKQMSKDYKKEFKKSESITSIVARIHRFRLQIHKINQFDKPTRVKMLFALSVPVVAKLLKELQKDAIVGLDVKRKIEKYKAKDGSFELEGDHSQSAKVKAGWADKKKKRRVVNDSRGKKRARVTYFSSETSETVDGDGEETEPSEDDIAMDSETNNIDNGGDNFDQLSYYYYNERDDAEDMDHIPVETKPESLIEVRIEVPEEPSGGEKSLEPKIEECTREVKQEVEEDEEGPSTTPSLNVSLLKFLYYFRRPVIKLKVPFVANKFDNEIKKLMEKDKQISITKILKSLEYLIKILKTPDEMNSHENTISLSDFINQLELSTWYICHPLINEFQRKTRELVATEDQRIPIEHIRYAMKTALDKILH